jgi:hypothetical protein
VSGGLQGDVLPGERFRGHRQEPGAVIQGCQIILGATHQNGKNVPNDHKICIPKIRKIYQIAVKYSKWPYF